MRSVIRQERYAACGSQAGIVADAVSLRETVPLKHNASAGQFRQTRWELLYLNNAFVRKT
jgi:hypothetical protein